MFPKGDRNATLDGPFRFFFFRQQVYRLIEGLTVEKGPAGADAAYAVYTQVWSNTEDQEVIKRTVVDVETDYIFLVPTQQTLQLHRKNAK